MSRRVPRPGLRDPSGSNVPPSLRDPAGRSEWDAETFKRSSERPPTVTLTGSPAGPEPLRSLGARRLGLVTTYPPTECGISKFSQSLVKSIASTGSQIDVEIVRLIDNRSIASNADDSVLEIIPDLPLGIRAAARRLNDCDVVVLQHEYGIYGANDGESVLDLIRRVHRPMIAVLHTVLAEPSPDQRRIIEALAAHCRIVTISDSAREILATSYSIESADVTMIPHGSGWSPHPPNRAPRRELITWGLLGPGKGLERAIGALPDLRNLDPRPRYRIVGRTHPAIARRNGLSYRKGLEDLIVALGVEDMVEFVDSYLHEQELEELVAAADVVLIPYDNNNQVSSGVLIEAVSAGRPVVATRFPHAVEMLRNGAGITVAHDSREIAEAVRALLSDPELYLASASVASAQSPHLSWERCGREYTRLANRVLVEQLESESIDA